jgi:hypothetical protein
MYLTFKLALPYFMIFLCALKPDLLRGSTPYFRSRYGASGQGYQALESESASLIHIPLQSSPCPPYPLIVDFTQSDKLMLGSACMAVYWRYIHLSCSLDKNDTACPARAAGNFSCVPVGEAYPGRRSVYFYDLCDKRNNVVSCWAWSAEDCAISGLPGNARSKC